MSDLHDSGDDLHVLRSLRERAPVYRAIFSPTALMGSALSLAVSALFYFGAERGRESYFHLSYPDAGRRFTGVWLAVLMVTLLTGVFFIWRKARAKGARFSRRACSWPSRRPRRF